MDIDALKKVYVTVSNGSISPTNTGSGMNMSKTTSSVSGGKMQIPLGEIVRYKNHIRSADDRFGKCTSYALLYSSMSRT